jgi:hypothetical protein
MAYKMKVTFFVKKDKDDTASIKIKKGSSTHYLGNFWGEHQIASVLHQKIIELSKEAWPAWVASLGYTIEEENIA